MSGTHDPTLERIYAFNRELELLVAAGLPLQIGLAPGENLSRKLDVINHRIALGIGRGKTIQQVLDECAEIPTRYRAAVSALLASNDARIALECLMNPVRTQRQLSQSVSRLLFYPFVIATMSFGVLLILVTISGPAIEGAIHQFRLEASTQWSWFDEARQWMHWWATLLPIVLLGALLGWLYLMRRNRFRWLPGARRFYEAMENAQLANQLRAMVQSGCALPQALAMAGPVGNNPGREDLKPHSLPPLLRWALTRSPQQTPDPQLLRFVAETYEQSAQRQSHRWQYAIPGILGVLIGGVFVLLYGVGLFLPLAELLEHISAVTGG